MRDLWRGLMVLFCLTLLTGIFYPLIITGIGQTFFESKANGSLIDRNGILIGSKLIGQDFTAPEYFWGRPSATNPPYNPLASSGSNLGPTNPALFARIKERIALLNAADSTKTSTNIIPIDLLTASASGLDPDISVAAAYYQAARIAKARGLTLDAVKQLIAQNTTPLQFGFMGEPRVNVLELNIMLDSTLQKK